MKRLAILVILSVAACGPPGEVLPDAGDDAPDGDVPMGGLEFRFDAPLIDTPIGDVVVDELRLWLRDIRAVGDAAPGEETYREAQEIRITGRDPAAPIVFAEAPPGRYSAFEFQLDRDSDGAESWRIRGDCTLAGETYQLEVDDEESLSVSLPIDLLLGAGETRIVHVEVDLERVVEGVDWSQGDIEEDKLVVEEDSPLMPGMRVNLLAAFSIAQVE
jgi:hypothetical protein